MIELLLNRCKITILVTVRKSKVGNFLMSHYDRTYSLLFCTRSLRKRVHWGCSSANIPASVQAYSRRLWRVHLIPSSRNQYTHIPLLMVHITPILLFCSYCTCTSNARSRKVRSGGSGGSNMLSGHSDSRTPRISILGWLLFPTDEIAIWSIFLLFNTVEWPSSGILSDFYCFLLFINSLRGEYFIW